MDKKELQALRKKCRHKAEIPAYVIAALIALAILGTVIYYGLIAEATEDVIQSFSDYLDCSTEMARFLLSFRHLIAVAVLVLCLGKFIWAIYRDIGKAMALETPVSDGQYQQVKELCREYAGKLGIDERDIPGIFIAAPGTIKVDSMNFCNLNILRIPPSTLSAGLRGSDIMIRYEAAQSVAALFLGYRSYTMIILRTFVDWIPLFPALLDRIMCYSVDRVVQVLMGQKDAEEAIIKDQISSYLYNSIDFDAYCEDISRFSGFNVFLENLAARRPIPRYRIAAVRDPEQKPGRLF